MKIKYILFTVVVIFLSACSKPLPSEKMNYAGEWQSKEMGLLILADGTVSYKRLKGGGTTSVNGPLKEFNGNDFIVGVGPITTTFVVSEPPLEIDGVWQMVVDGVRLSKVSE